MGLVALTFGIYGQTVWHPFINLDDEVLIYGNPHVRSGLRWENILWAFTSTSGASFWHPLTWLSHMLDVELFGMNAGGHHLMSVGIHALNAMVLFLVLARMTGFPWRSAFVAALFAVHPLHVESVAWAAERKDVLGALFFLLSLWAYTRYVERPGVCRYGWVALCFALSLMSKSMGVTLPFVLLLLDYWPLRRIEGITPVGEDSDGKCPHVTWKRALLEKVPLFLMAAVSVALTLSYEGDSTWVTPWDALPIGYRVANAVVSYALYLWRTVWPVDLAVFYPHPGREIAMWKVGISGLFLSVATVLAVRFGKRRPYLPVGWFYYLGTLVPVIGLVQVGSQAMADRFTYIPLIGIFILIVWGVPEAIGRLRHRNYFLGSLGGAILLALSAAAWLQNGYWRDTIALYSRAQDVTENNWFAMNGLGVVYAELGQTQEAIVFYREALRLKPKVPEILANLGAAYDRIGDSFHALEIYREALRLKPGDPKTRHDIGLVYARLGQFQQAIANFREALRIKPDYPNAWNNMGLSYDRLGQSRQAIEYYREALRLKPDFSNAWYNMGVSYEKLGQSREAASCFQNARQIKGD